MRDIQHVEERMKELVSGLDKEYFDTMEVFDKFLTTAKQGD